jgi:hypothetical protein
MKYYLETNSGFVSVDRVLFFALEEFAEHVVEFFTAISLREEALFGFQNLSNRFARSPPFQFFPHQSVVFVFYPCSKHQHNEHGKGNQEV